MRRKDLYFLPTFPGCFAKAVRHTPVVLGIGGNIGNVPRRFKKLALLLASHPRVRLVRSAPILKNPPFGYLDQPDFYNSVLLVDTTLSPQALLHFLLRVEKRFGRVRTFKNAPRTLDIDIIFYDNMRIKRKDLTIPHPHWMERESVVVPLYYLGEGRCDL